MDILVQDKRWARLADIEAGLSEEFKAALLSETERVCGRNYALIPAFRREWLLAYERLAGGKKLNESG
jgi:hypothetical protein